MQEEKKQNIKDRYNTLKKIKKYVSQLERQKELKEQKKRRKLEQKDQEAFSIESSRKMEEHRNYKKFIAENEEVEIVAYPGYDEDL